MQIIVENAELNYASVFSRHKVVNSHTYVGTYNHVDQEI